MIHSCRFAVLMLAAWLLSACAHFEPSQREDQARFLVGSLDGDARFRQTSDVASLYAQYAALSALAYEDALYRIGTGHRSGLEDCAPSADCTAVAARLAQIRTIWGQKPLLARINDCSIGPELGGRRDFDHEGRSGHCGLDRPDRHRVLDGLGIQVWVRPGDRCSEMVIAFRGTDFSQADDWISNLRWVTRVLPVHDQYEQVREHVDRIIADAIAMTRCNPRRITAVGHSLGGGLAQHAAYAQLPRAGRAPITRVFAFDPSFVTGYSDRAIQGDRLSRATQRLKIDRVYEHGEILAYPRFVLRNLLPPTACSPQIRLVRFNLAKGNIVAQHNMARFTQRLLLYSPRKLVPRMVDDSQLLPAAPEALETDGSCRLPSVSG